MVHNLMYDCADVKYTGSPCNAPYLAPGRPEERTNDSVFPGCIYFNFRLLTCVEEIMTTLYMYRIL